MNKSKIVLFIALLLGTLPLLGSLAYLIWSAYVESKTKAVYITWVHFVAVLLFIVGVVVYFYAARAFRKKPTTVNIVLIIYGLITTGYFCRLLYHIYDKIHPVTMYGTCYYTAAVRTRANKKTPLRTLDLIVVDDHLRQCISYLSYERHNSDKKHKVNEKEVRRNYYSLVTRSPTMSNKEIVESLSGYGIVTIYTEKKTSEQRLGD